MLSRGKKRCLTTRYHKQELFYEKSEKSCAKEDKGEKKKKSHALWCRSLTPASPGLGEDETDALWSAAVLLQNPKLLDAMGPITKPSEALLSLPAE